MTELDLRAQIEPCGHTLADQEILNGHPYCVACDAEAKALTAKVLHEFELKGWKLQP